MEPLKAANPEEKKGPDKYEIESWTRTVLEAQEIMNDPEKMALVQKELGKKKVAIDKVVGDASVSAMDKLRAKKKKVDEASED